MLCWQSAEYAILSWKYDFVIQCRNDLLCQSFGSGLLQIDEAWGYIIDRGQAIVAMVGGNGMGRGAGAGEEGGDGVGKEGQRWVWPVVRGEMTGELP